MSDSQGEVHAQAADALSRDGGAGVRKEAARAGLSLRELGLTERAALLVEDE